MERIVDASAARQLDRISIEEVGIPSLVLMERAALCVAQAVRARADGFKKAAVKILAVCGRGNNGADAVAAARMLGLWGYDVELLTVGDKTPELMLQLSIADKIGLKVYSQCDEVSMETKNSEAGNVRNLDEYDIIIDGLFGVGLNRDVEGTSAKLVEKINESGACVVAVDVPSGINATDGRIMGVAVRSDETVTFGYMKLGLLLYPGAEYAGNARTVDIGFASCGCVKAAPAGFADCGNVKAAFARFADCASRLEFHDKRIRNIFYFNRDDLKNIPKRMAYSNKGTYGKLLIVAGSENMGGASCLAALAAYRTGAGMVKVFTHENNRTAILGTVPEALVETYGNDESQDINLVLGHLLQAVRWADCVVIGPGLGQGELACAMVGALLDVKGIRLLLDADALNIVSACGGLQKWCAAQNAERTLVVTPHLGEMARLTACTVGEIRNSLVDVAVGYAVENNVYCVLKDARTIVASPEGDVYVNVSGNSGMATAGSGDVLAGVVGGMCCVVKDVFKAVCCGVYLHGLGGDYAAGVWGRHGMKAGDIIDGVAKSLFEVRL